MKEVAESSGTEAAEKIRATWERFIYPVGPGEAAIRFSPEVKAAFLELNKILPRGNEDASRNMYDSEFPTSRRVLRKHMETDKPISVHQALRCMGTIGEEVGEYTKNTESHRAGDAFAALQRALGGDEGVTLVSPGKERSR